MDNETVKLIKPIKVGGKEVVDLTVRSVTFGDLKMAGIRQYSDIEDIGKFTKIVGFMTGATPEELDQADMRDWIKITRAANGFLGLIPQTNI